MKIYIKLKKGVYLEDFSKLCCTDRDCDISVVGKILPSRLLDKISNKHLFEEDIIRKNCWFTCKDNFTVDGLAGGMKVFLMMNSPLIKNWLWGDLIPLGCSDGVLSYYNKTKKKIYFSHFFDIEDPNKAQEAISLLKSKDYVLKSIFQTTENCVDLFYTASRVKGKLHFPECVGLSINPGRLFLADGTSTKFENYIKYKLKKRRKVLITENGVFGGMDPIQDFLRKEGE